MEQRRIDVEVQFHFDAAVSRRRFAGRWHFLCYDLHVLKVDPYHVEQPLKQFWLCLNDWNLFSIVGQWLLKNVIYDQGPIQSNFTSCPWHLTGRNASTMHVFKYTVAQAENSSTSGKPRDHLLPTRLKQKRTPDRRQTESGWTMTIIINYNRSTAGLMWFYVRTISKYNIFHKLNV